MRLLVTGGAGYIGTVDVARLVEEGHHLTGFDDLSQRYRDTGPAGADFVLARIHDAARHETGYLVATMIDSRRDGAPAVLVASDERTRSHLDWTPDRRDVTTMVRNPSPVLHERVA